MLPEAEYLFTDSLTPTGEYASIKNNKYRGVHQTRLLCRHFVVVVVSVVVAGVVVFVVVVIIVVIVFVVVGDGHLKSLNSEKPLPTDRGTEA